MNYFNRITAVAIFTILLFFNTFYCVAEDLVWNEEEKEVIFNLAKEQDKFVLLFVGNHDCSLCNRAFRKFNDPEQGLRKVVEDNYITWFVPYYVPNTSTKSDMEHIKLYIADYEEKKYAGIRTNFPILCVINPDDPDEDFTFYWGVGERTLKELQDAITPPDIFSSRELTWFENESDVFRVALEQGKNIFKLAGKATSPNSKTVMKRLAEEPLKQLLEDNYILWYSSDIPELNVETYAETSPYTLPYISIINPEEPDETIFSVFGYQDVETLEEILKSYAVANERVVSDNNVTVSGNILQIASRTNNEQIKVFTMTGQQVASVRKNDYTIRIDTSNFPKGVLVVYGSTGWSAKIPVR